MSDNAKHDTSAGSGLDRGGCVEDMAQILDGLSHVNDLTASDLDAVLSGLLEEIDTKLADVTATLNRIRAV